MNMTQLEFEQLCREASMQLNLFDTQAMGAGATFFLGEIESEMTFNELKCSAQLSCELGDPEPGAEEDVYRRLLEIQSTFVGQMDAMFVRDPINSRLLFTCRIPLHAQLTATGFAQALKVLAGLVEHWQTTTLGSALVDYEREFEERMARIAATGAPMTQGGSYE